MSATPKDSLAIATVSPEEVPEALRLVFSGLAEGQDEEYVRCVAVAMQSGEIQATGLLEARRGRRRVGAAWFHELAGGTALVWPPRLVPGEPAETASRLMAAGCQRLSEAGVVAANAILANVTPEDDLVLRTAGFQPLATLLYLACEDSVFPKERPGGRLAFEPWRPGEERRLAQLVQATYEGSLDCPDAEETRPPEEVLAGYRAIGVFSPDHWLFARFEGHDVGCLLLADHPTFGNMEVVYLGLVPSSRGRGLGREICHHAQWLARRAGRRRLVAAVDSANLPAVRMYTSTGFSVWDQRAAYLKRFPR
jgi:ribosomal protein S18 acetylase RimI-like enzyme